MMPGGVFEQRGRVYTPTRAAVSPWGADRLHGGPILGLCVHVVRQAFPDPALEVTRLTADLFARVPNAPLEASLEVVRDGRRVVLCDVALHAGGAPVSRASVLLARSGEGAYRVLDEGGPPGPESLPARPLISERRRHKMPPGFHTEVETRFGPAAGLGQRFIWFRMPMPLVSGLASDPAVAVAALSDFNNAVGSIAAYEDGRRSAHINADTTIYFERPPVGEWFALKADMQSDRDGISVSQVLLYDVQGRLGRSLQARLETPFGSR